MAFTLLRGQRCAICDCRSDLGIKSIHPLLTKWLLKKAVKDKLKQYRTARYYAVPTAPCFAKAYKLLVEHLFQPLRESSNPHTCLLVHSLGHLVLKTAYEQHLDLLQGYSFNACMLHQADEENQQHQSWISGLPLVANSNTYVTRNKHDWVLFVSGLANNNFDHDKVFTRLGNRAYQSTEQGTDFNYVDFTDCDDVWLQHGIAWDDDRSPHGWVYGVS